MGRGGNQDRFLLRRVGIYYYWRRVPSEVASLDDRSPVIRTTLKTRDLAKARAMRDVLERADDELWGSLLRGGKDAARSRAAYEAAKIRARALGFTYHPASEIAQQPLEDIISRIIALPGNATAPTEQALLGGQELPSTTVTAAFEIYCDEIMAAENRGKSASQKKKWKATKSQSINSFVSVIGDKDMEDITREDARKFYQHWVGRVTGEERISASMGKRIMGNMRVLYASYFKYMGQPDRQNPFAGLSFSEKNQRSRPPLEVAWVKNKILAPGAMASLNSEARAIVLTMIETGARPSEICNLTPALIHLHAKVPHISIEPRDDPDDPREIKTATSSRKVPLVGVALEAMKRFPQGFPRYKDRENSLSTALNKYFRDNGLFPSKQHSMYSIRHTFEDRMKEAGVDEELRKILMGHAIDRPKYGSGGGLEWRRDQLLKIVLPFSPEIV